MEQGETGKATMNEIYAVIPRPGPVLTTHSIPTSSTCESPSNHTKSFSFPLSFSVPSAPNPLSPLIPFKRLSPPSLPDDADADADVDIDVNPDADPDAEESDPGYSCGRERDESEVVEGDEAENVDNSMDLDDDENDAEDSVDLGCLSVDAGRCEGEGEGDSLGDSVGDDMGVANPDPDPASSGHRAGLTMISSEPTFAAWLGRGRAVVRTGGW